MKITQLSVFLENRPGRLSALCRTLADAGVNLSTLMLSDNGEFGLLRLLKLVGKLLQNLGNRRVKYEVRAGYGERRAGHTELKFVAGESKVGCVAGGVDQASAYLAVVDWGAV